MPIFQVLLRCRSCCTRCAGVLAVLAAVVLGAPRVLAQRPLTEVDRELLETRIEALERRLDGMDAPAQVLRDEERRTTAEQIRRLDEKIDGRTWAFTVVIGLVLAAAALIGFLLNFVGWPALKQWIQSTVHSRAEVEVKERVEAVNIDALVLERAAPIIESSVRGLETETRKDMIAATEQYKRELQEGRDALQATANPTPEQTSTVSDLVESQKQSNPNQTEWSALDWILDARRLSDEGQNEAALGSISRALELETDNPVAHNNRGVALTDLGRHEQALAALNRALAIRPNDSMFLSNLCYVLSNLNRYDEALDAIDRSLAIHPGSPTNLASRGSALNGLGRYEEALSTFEQSLAIVPDNPMTLSSRGNALKGLGRYGDALDTFDQSLAVQPDNLTTRSSRGSALNGLGRYEEALEEFDRVLAIRPDDSTTLTNRGSALNGLGRYEEALIALDRSIALKPEEHPAAHHHRSRAKLALGDPEGALQSAEQAVALSETVPDKDYRRAVSLYFRGIALRLLGRETLPTEKELDEALLAPFQQPVSWCVIEPAVSPDPDVQAFVTRLSDKLRAHDAARAA